MWRHSRHRGTLLTLGVWVLVCSLSQGLHSQESEGSFGRIQVLVLPAPGEYVLPGTISATLTSSKRDLIRTNTISATGQFQFENLPADHYSIRIASPGYSNSVQRIQLGGSLRGEVVFVSIHLGKPIAENPNLPPNPNEKTVSTEWLSIPRAARREMEKASRASRKGNPEKAIDHLQKALGLYPRLPQAYNNLAAQYIRLDRLDEAATAARKAIELNPEDSFAFRNLAIVRVRQGADHEALEALHQSDKFRPSDYRTLSLMAAIHFRLGDYLPALRHYRDAYEARPTHHEYQLKMAECQIRLKSYGEAILLLEAFLNNSPNHRRREEIGTLILRLRAIQSRQRRSPH